MKNLIKILDPEKAEELIAIGFKYTLESINNNTVYAFFVCPELINYLNSNFTANDFFLENVLRF